LKVESSQLEYAIISKIVKSEEGYDIVRERGKLMRRSETDAIQQLKEYARRQGASKGYLFWIYKNFTETTNHALFDDDYDFFKGKNLRDHLSTRQSRILLSDLNYSSGVKTNNLSPLQ